MNTSMFLPQSPEQDAYDASGRQLDDINSVVEYIQVSLGSDITSDDEDDDNGQTFHLVKAANYYFTQHYSIVQKTKTREKNPRDFVEYQSGKISTIPIDIITPPPEVG